MLQRDKEETRRREFNEGGGSRVKERIWEMRANTKGLWKSRMETVEAS